MSISISSELETILRTRADAMGLTVEGYIEGLVRADERAENELEELALEGINSGTPLEIGPGYWEEKHRRLDERLRNTSVR
jgi:hypothetical protein